VTCKGRKGLLHWYLKKWYQLFTAQHNIHTSQRAPYLYACAQVSEDMLERSELEVSCCVHLVITPPDKQRLLATQPCLHWMPLRHAGCYVHAGIPSA
jgi:hypothetical protein